MPCIRRIGIHLQRSRKQISHIYCVNFKMRTHPQWGHFVSSTLARPPRYRLYYSQINKKCFTKMYIFPKSGNKNCLQISDDAFEHKRVGQQMIAYYKDSMRKEKSFCLRQSRRTIANKSTQNHVVFFAVCTREY